MASYRGHLMLSAPLGAAYGALVLSQPEFDWGTAVLAAALTTVGGLLPDLDSDSGVPVRELFGTIAALVALFAFRPLLREGFTVEQTLAVVCGLYVLVRYGVSSVFKSVTVHRGMFHSIPANLIAGLVIYLGYPSTDIGIKLYLAGGVALGYLSHLMLDEIYAVDFNGLSLKTNQFAGTALKFASGSMMATLLTYTVLGGLGYVTLYGLPDEVRQPMKWLKSLRDNGGQRTNRTSATPDTSRSLSANTPAASSSSPR